jgi:hypothetical protein
LIGRVHVFDRQVMPLDTCRAYRFGQRLHPEHRELVSLDQRDDRTRAPLADRREVRPKIARPPAPNTLSPLFPGHSVMPTNPESTGSSAICSGSASLVLTVITESLLIEASRRANPFQTHQFTLMNE